MHSSSKDPLVLPPTWRMVVAVAVAVGLAARAVAHKSLTKPAAAAAFVTGVITFSAGLVPGTALMGFFITSSIFTKVGKERKRILQPDYDEESQRTVVQVAANSVLASLGCIAYGICARWREMPLDSTKAFWPTFWLSFILGHYACANGDTWSSELGILAKQKPRLITSMREVPPGTNGGITFHGLVGSAAAGLQIGVVAWLVGWAANDLESFNQWKVVLLCTYAGLVGSLVDSLLGATLQYSGWNSERKVVVEQPGPDVERIAGYDILDNHAVNFLSVGLTGLFTAWTATRWF